MSAVTLMFSLYPEHFMRNTGLDELQSGIRIGRRKSIITDMRMMPKTVQTVAQLHSSHMLAM